MNEAEIRQTVKRALHRIAPEADLESLPGNADLRETIDLDSMDVLNLFVNFHELLKVDIPESDYGRLRTLDGCVEYLVKKTS